MTDEMGQQVVIFPAKAEDINSIIGAHILEGGKPLFSTIHRAVHAMCTQIHTHMRPHIYIY